jgi:dCTP deaminase
VENNFFFAVQQTGRGFPFAEARLEYASPQRISLAGYCSEAPCVLTVQAVASTGGGKCMPNLISGNRLKKAVSDGSIIMDGDPASVENVKYDFHMGSRVLKAAIGRPIDLSEMPQGKAFVEPGEAVFVLTKEKLNLPNNIMASLTPKRKLAHGGILILGGLTVDPLYRGYLLIGLYNFSSTPFALLPGKKIIGALFYELDSESVETDSPTPQEMLDFPDELIALIRNYQPVELNGLGNQISDLGRELASLRNEISGDKVWRDEFRSSLDEHNNQLGKLIEGLKDEKEVRTKDDEKINTKLESMSKMFFGYNLMRVGLWSLFLIVFGSVAGYLVPKIFGGS